MRANRRHHKVRWLLALLLALACHASAASWKERVLYSFQGGSDGQVPAGGVVFDNQGNLYGATETGTVFQLAPPANKGDPWTETVLYLFLGRSNNNDGLQPSGGLVIDSSGNLYGTTAYGGTGGCILLGIPYGCGTVYELSPPKQKGGQWTETILYSFQGGNDGYYPWGNLTFDKSGTLFGATQFGGGKGTQCNPYYQYCGTVFKLSPPKQKGGQWMEKVLYSFAGVANGHQSGDGANPNGGLALDGKGAVYGTTYFGGNNQKGVCEGGVGGTGCGTVFKLTPPARKEGAWTEGLLHLFDVQDGVNPDAGVILDERGDVYGTTYGGPRGGYGLVFELAKPSEKSHSWIETELHVFSGGSDGAYPDAGLVFNADGDLYGTASVYGGSSDYGTAFRLKPPVRKGGTWSLGVLYAFPGVPDGRIPKADLIFDKSGHLYSTTTEGGTGTCGYFGCGTVFEISP